ncbi:DUF4380 domain-containing protein [Dysgonomonas sp. 520]|uniref:DUF4380 domain-containing protein n=1 Tax=Dysgonomonas sp. 520 TaxID=2302931 RepID=UPI0013D72460|nr:DUF4380 domain-containing protein [Dysgonomonas sp. 520]NDW09951.1 DUF4380 domain-containing protein [Dysgonomonas sp. 520]
MQGDLSFTVSGTNGGRIVSFKCAGQEILLSEKDHPLYYGATLWPSPQRRFWPPSPILDAEPYFAEVEGNLLRLISEKDSLKGFRFTKEFSFSKKDKAISINYTIENISDTTQHVAAWDVTRVPGGVTFFPVKDKYLKDLPSNLDHVSEQDGIIRYNYSQDSIKRGQKLFATTQEGWLAHQYKDLVLVKQFPMTQVKDLPLLQGEVEIFLAPNSQYVELENHGKYTELRKGESLHYQQKWFLFQVGKDEMQNQSKIIDTIRRRLHILTK